MSYVLFYCRPFIHEILFSVIVHRRLTTILCVNPTTPHLLAEYETTPGKTPMPTTKLQYIDITSYYGGLPLYCYRMRYIVWKIVVLLVNRVWNFGKGNWLYVRRRIYPSLFLFSIPIDTHFWIISKYLDLLFLCKTWPMYQNEF